VRKHILHTRVCVQLKVKRKFVFCIRDGGIEAMKVQLHLFLTSALDGDKWLDERTSHSTLREKPRIIHWVEGRVVPRAGLEVLDKR
jgi:hypothetical protein